MMAFRTLIASMLCVFVASCSVQSSSAVVMVALPNSTAIENAPKVAEPALEKMAQGICGQPVELNSREFRVQVAQDVELSPIMVSANFRCSR